MNYNERMAVEQERERLRRERDDEKRNGVAATRANDSRIVGNNNAMHGQAGRKWLGGESGAVSDGSALHGKAGRKWLGGGGPEFRENRNPVAFSSTTGGALTHSFLGSGGTWNDVLMNQRAYDNAIAAQRLMGEQRAVYDEMTQVMEASRRENAKKQLALANDVSTAMALADGGAIPEEIRNLINRRHGFDGKTTGILPTSGFDGSTGNFELLIGSGVDGRGNVVTSRQVFDPISQYQMMSANRVAFDDAARADMRGRLAKRYGYSERELSNIDNAFQQFALSSGSGGRSGATSLEDRRIASAERERIAEMRQEDRRIASAERERIAEMRQEGLMRKNVMDALRGNYEFQQMLISDPEKAAELAYKYEQKFNELSGKSAMSAKTEDGQNSRAVISGINGGGAKTRTSNADYAKRKAEIKDLLKERKAGGAAESQAQTTRQASATAQKPTEKSAETAQTQPKDEDSVANDGKKYSVNSNQRAKTDGMSISVEDLTLDEEDDDSGDAKHSRRTEEKARMKKVLDRARAEKILSGGGVETASSESDAYEIARKLGRDKVNSLSDDEIERVFRGGFSKIAAGNASAIKDMLNIMFDNDERANRIVGALKKAGNKLFGGSGMPRMR